jgi:hypothetical protein
MKKIIVVTLLTLFNQSLLAASPEGTYGVHFYFDEREFVDVLTISKGENGKLQGHMHVPDDFDQDIEEIKVEGVDLSFDLFVPKNLSRPKDYIFQYKGTFFDENYKQLIGFATIKGQKGFVAAFVAFRRD